jgi:VCBS repeat-containing protein
MFARAKTLLVVFLFLFSWTLIPGSASADDVTLTGTISFNSLDGSAEDHDGAVNGVFTVNDGDLVVEGTVQCNDDPPLSGNAGACAIAINVSGDLTVEAGGAIFAENRLGGGAGGDITLTVGRELILHGPSGALPGAVVSSSRLTGKDTAGDITVAVQGNVHLEAGSTVAASTPNGAAGTIGITAGGTVLLEGLVASGPSRQVLGTKLTGKILNGGESKQTGGAILVEATGILVEGGGIIVSQGESSGSQVVQFDACDIQIRGLVASVLKQNGPSQVVLRSGEGLVIDGRDLGTSGPSLGRFGRVRADGTEGGSAGYMVDLFANDDIEVLGPVSSSLFAVSSSPGPIAQRSGGAITAISLAGGLTASGNAFEAGKSTTGNQGGIIDLKAKEDATLDGATLRAMGDHLTTASSRKGGSISVRSYQGSVSWTFGVGDVRPTGSGVSASRRGSITLTACTGIDTTGTQFPTVGAAVPPFPVENEGVCAPAAPSLPSGEPPLPVCNQPPVANDDAYTVAEDGTLNQAAPGVLGNDTDPDADPLTAVLVSGPSHASSFTLNTDGSFTYEHDGSETTPDTFTYKANDGSSSSNTATVTITVTPVDDSPTAVDDAATVAEDSGANAIDVLANDTDPDGGAISVASVTQPVNGTVAITGGGTGLTYTPNANYCNTPPGTALDTFTYTLSPGSDTATVTVTVNCADDSPTAVNDAATVAEDSGANPINVQANDTDPDGGTNTITAVTQPANGAVVITNGGADLTYTPNANYCNTPPGTTLDAFTYTLSPGGTMATVTVTVTCVDDNPVAVMDAATVAEDSGANTINVLANDTDIDAGPISITSVTQPANGAVVITNGGADLTYAPGANYCNNPPGTTPDTFTYTLSPGGSTATVSVTVTCVNDGPSIDLDANDDQGTTGSDFAVTFTEGDAAKLIQDPLDATVADIDNTTLASLTVTITNLLDAEDETLSADVTGTSITANYVAATGVLTLTGPDTLANFEAVLRTVRYLNTDNAPDATPREIHFVANDGTADGNTAVSTVTMVPVDTSPTAVDDAATVNEDSGANSIDVLANDTDPDGGAISVASVTQPTHGTVAITGGGTGLTYTPNANYCNSVSGGPDTFTYTLSPGNSTATVSVTVTCVDDNPTAVADAATVVEDSTNNPIDVLANDTDPDGGTKLVTAVNTAGTNGTVSIVPGGTGVTYTPNANYCNTQPGGTADTFTYTITGGSTATVSVTVTCVDDDPVAVADAATVVEDSSGNILNVLANDTDVDGGAISIQSVTQPANGSVTNNTTNVTYTPNPNYCNNPPGTALDTFTYTLTPGGSSTTVTVTVTCVDDPPVAVNDSATVLEDSGATSVPVLANDTDPDAGPISITSVTQPTNGTVVITGGGTGLTYAPNANYCNNPSGTPDTFTYTLTPDGSTATVSMTVTCVNDAPVLATNPITYTAPGNTQLHVAGATLAGVASWSDAQSATAKSSPSDIDGPGPLQVVAASGNSTNGGSFSITTTGSFTYVPPVGFTGTDSFTYAVTDNGTPAATVTGTINITVGQRVWYIRDVIDANNAAGGDGRSSNAFDSIAAFNAATTNDGDIIFVFEGNTGTTPLTGSISLRNGQKLWGQGIALNVPGFGTPLANATNKPRVRTTTASTDVVSVPATAGNRTNVEIRGLDLEATGATSNAIDITSSGANNVSVTINTNNVRGATAEGIDVNAGSTGTATIAIHDNTLTSNGAAIDITRTAGTVVITAFDDNMVTGDTNGAGIVVTGPATFDATAGGALDPVSGGVTVIGAPGNAITGAGLTLGSVTGALNFADLDVFAGGAGVVITGSGAFTGAAGTRVTVPNGVSIIQAGNGPGVDVSNATLDLRLSSLTVSASPTTGVSLVNVSDGTVAPTSAFFSAGSGSTIVNVTGTDFNVDGGNATVSYGGSINNTAGRSLAVQNRTGDSVTFTNTSTITDNGTGILVNANAAGAVTDVLGTLTLSTGANAAFAAASGGTLRVMGAANTITTATGVALNVTNTTIGAGSGAPETGLRFRSISAGTGASGPANGIVLNNTGASGSLTVTGTGGAGTGGTIQRTTSHGVSLTSTLSPSFTSMSILNTGGSGVKGTQVTNFTFVNGSIDNSGTALGVDESNIAFNNSAVGTENNLSGTVTITGNTLTNAYYHGIDILNSNGTLSNITISGNTLTSATSTASSKGSGIRLQGLGSSTTVANIAAATLSNNIISRFPSGNGILVNCGNASTTGSGGSCGTPGSGTNVITITGNTIAGQANPNQMGSNAIAVAVTGGNGASRSQANFDVSSNGTAANPLTNFKGTGVACSVFGMSTATCNVTNNYMVANNVLASRCIAVGVDRTIAAGDTPNLTATISNNRVIACDGNGIFTGAINSNGIARLKIQNNNIDAPLTGVRQGIRVDSGTPAAAGTNTTVCLNISGNTSAGSTPASLGIGLRKEGTATATNVFAINGMAATSSPGVETYVNGLNPAGGGTLLISAASGFSNCSLP